MPSDVIPSMNAAKNAIIYPSGKNTLSPDFNIFIPSSKFAPSIAGIEIINENLNASCTPIPIKRLAAMVIPERDTPGRTAIPCAIPTNIAAFNNDEFCLLCESIGTHAKIIAVKINPKLTKTGDDDILSTTSRSESPIPPVKNVAIKIAQPYVQPFERLPNHPINHSLITEIISFLKYIINAITVAKCSNKSNATKFSVSNPK